MIPRTMTQAYSSQHFVLTANDPSKGIIRPVEFRSQRHDHIRPVHFDHMPADANFLVGYMAVQTQDFAKDVLVCDR